MENAEQCCDHENGNQIAELAVFCVAVEDNRKALECFQAALGRGYDDEAIACVIPEAQDLKSGGIYENAVRMLKSSGNDKLYILFEKSLQDYSLVSIILGPLNPAVRAMMKEWMCIE